MEKSFNFAFGIMLIALCALVIATASVFLVHNHNRFSSIEDRMDGIESKLDQLLKLHKPASQDPQEKMSLK